jgi:hypothetical protein
VVGLRLGVPGVPARDQLEQEPYWEHLGKGAEAGVKGLRLGVPGVTVGVPVVGATGTGAMLGALDAGAPV